MNTIKVFDIELNPIEHFTQYDLNRIILVPKYGLDDNVFIHAGAVGADKTYILDTTSCVLDSNHFFRAVIPNVLLKEDAPICIYLVCDTVNNETITFGEKKITIRKRSCPDGYIYENNSKFYSVQKIQHDLNQIQNRTIITENIDITEWDYNNIGVYEAGENLIIRYGENNEYAIQKGTVFGFDSDSETNICMIYSNEGLITLHKKNIEY